MSVWFSTSVGDFVIDLEYEAAPKACENFIRLCQLGYYIGVIWHSVHKDFVLQSGDPLGNGEGGQSYWSLCGQHQSPYFTADKTPRLKHTGMGVVGTNQLCGSQFYIQASESPLPRLDGKNTVFGHVSEGMNTIEAISEAFVDLNGRPLQNIRIVDTMVIFDPFSKDCSILDNTLCHSSFSSETQWFQDFQQKMNRVIGGSDMLAKQRYFAAMSLDCKKDGKSIEHERREEELEKLMKLINIRDISTMEKREWMKKSEKQMMNELADRNERSDALALQILRDIPDSDVKPPENVLFVCKLNALTEAEDLQIIFEQYGPIVECAVIKDWKTEESLCYAFITYENRDSAERAYVELNNCLVDDRRIKVDFSQSVAKYWQFHRNGGKFTKENTRHLNDEQQRGRLMMDNGRDDGYSYYSRKKRRLNNDDHHSHSSSSSSAAYSSGVYDHGGRTHSANDRNDDDDNDGAIPERGFLGIPKDLQIKLGLRDTSRYDRRKQDPHSHYDDGYGHRKGDYRRDDRYSRDERDHRRRYSDHHRRRYCCGFGDPG